ncbi:hypothetical protein [Oleiharenicola lentus]|uniref:hypothetical protein n=1 Tax=Oleiharenicola lentus TaxID=2508720 RepID=UPI003F66D213
MRWLDTPATPDLRFHRISFVLAFVITLIWGACYIGYNNPGLVDEPGQFEAILHFFFTRPGVPAALPNLPGYHFSVIWLTAGLPTLTDARLVTLGFACAGLIAFAGAWRQLHGSHPGGATLLLALLPVMQPFTAMAYTDVPAMALLFAAFWAHFSGQRPLSALLLVGACFIRQTCLVWAAFLLVADAAQIFFPEREQRMVNRMAQRAAWLEFIERNRWLLLLLVTSAGIVLYAGRLTVGSIHGNKPDPNIATLHFAAVLIAFFCLPLWPSLLRGSFEFLRNRWLHRRTSIVVAAIGAVGLAAIFFLTYRNPHPWNQPLFWDEPPCARILLRNWPIVGIDRFVALKAISSLLLVLVPVALGVALRGQRYARELFLIAPFGVALLLSNGLVDPRYLIPPCALGLLFIQPDRPSLCIIAGWFLLLCLIQSPLVMARLILW